ncbi:Dedicator of cytokinesis protein 9 isoform X26 [Oopsacas minuta]|uniref:Dedicator of cytokinesis protein 9 isoform X26 n=1 Tax=Oopsacas minuta TaxID=111878 RepID=A0AAV7KL23_9METZ|nr:Dedicator of cytokinesis protein 9 isoform X26 [Oopsacas minuta]
MSDYQKTRRFIQHLNPHPAAKMRESVSLAVRRRSMCLEPISRGHVPPSDYESSLQEKSEQIELDLCRTMLLFPEDDLFLKEELRDLRTEYSTVPEHAMFEATGLFAKECLQLFSQNWNVLRRTEEYFCGTSPQFMALEAGQAQEAEGSGPAPVTDTDTLITKGGSRRSSSLPDLPPVYEVDIVEAEEQQQQQKDSELTPNRDSALTRSGYLLQLNIASTGKLIGANRTIQTSKKRWHTLKMNSDGTGFLIESSKPGRGPGVGGKSVVSLVTCISVRKSIRGPEYSFELINSGNKVSHCFMADSNEEMIEWINAIASVLSSDIYMDSRGSSRFSIYTADTLKRGAMTGAHSQQRTTILSGRLQRVGDASADNAKQRRINRKKIFWLYENLARRKVNKYDNDMMYVQSASPPVLTPGFQFIATPEKLNFDLRISSATSRTHIEPFFTSAALYDARFGKKISEEFHFDLNGEERELFDLFLSTLELEQFDMDIQGVSTSIPVKPGFEVWPVEARRALFTVSYPHPDIYLVVRIDKVLQGSINSCVEPYQRGEGRKNILKLADQMKTVFPRLGNYKQPFAWSAKPVFLQNGDLDTDGHFPLIFKQEKERISEEEIIKLLKDFRNIPRLRIQVIPGSLSITLSPLTPEEPGIFTTGLVPLIPMMPTYNQAPFIREVQEFPTHSDILPSPTKLQPFQEFFHILYVYPQSLKLEGVKLGNKFKNLCVKIQFFDSDEKNARPLPNIFGKPPGNIFVDKALTSVIYHYTNPDFAEEVKIYLPIHLDSKHHLLFTYSHISCNIQKLPKKTSPEVVIGYSWLPVLKPHNDTLLNRDIFSLAISSSLPPNYLSHGLDGRSGDIKWIDNRKHLFRVLIRPISSISPQDLCVHSFFVFLEKIQRLNGGVDELEIQQRLQDLHFITLDSLISHLPVILNQLLKLFTLQTLNNNDTGIKILALLVDYAHTLDKHGSLHHLATYVKYQFRSEAYQEYPKEIYTELIRYMLYFTQQEGIDCTNLLKYLWFLLGCVSQSIGYHIFNKKSLRSNRKGRFGQGFYTHLNSLLSSLIALIRSKIDKSIAYIANQSIAVFVRDAFSYMDRGDVFTLVYKYVSQPSSPGEAVHLTKLKFNFLQIVFSHEHYIQLNLPIGDDTTGDSLKLGDEFCQNHYLVGILLREFYITLKYEKNDIRIVAIHMLKDLLAKHDTDPRYCNDHFKRSRVTSLYLPFLSMMLQFAPRVISGYDTHGYQSPQIEFNKSISTESSGMIPASRNLKGKKLSFSSPRGPPTTLRSDSSRNTYGTQSSRSDMRLTEINERPMSSSSQSVIDGKRESESSIQMRKKISSINQSSSYMTLHDEDSSELGRQNNSTDMELGLGQADFSLEEKQLLLACFLNLLKNSDSVQLAKWWDEYFSTLNSLPAQTWDDDEQLPSDFCALLSFFDLLIECLYTFSYFGKKAIYNETLPLVTRGGRDKGKTNTVITTVSEDGSTTSEDSHAMRVQKLAKARSEVSHEVSLILIGVLDVFSSRYHNYLESNSPMMKSYFKVIVTFFSLQHSDAIWVHWYAYLFSFVYNFPSLLFKGQNEFCEFIIFKCLAHCNSRLALVRNEACTLLYFLLRSNLEYSGENFVRTQLYSTISISKLSAAGLIGQSDTFLKRSLKSITTFSSSETSVKKYIQFQDEVQDLMRRLNDILSSQNEMRNVQHDYDELVEVHWRLAASYSNTPELRITWLDNLASMHLKEGFQAEAAQCYLHIAAIVAQYLYNFAIGKLHSSDFENISHNIPKDEGRMKIDQELRGNQSYSEKDLIMMLEKCLRFLYESELFELMLPVFKLILPLLEKNRDFEGMERLFRKMHESTVKTKQVMKTGKRFLGTYFRCKFYGKGFEGNHEKQFIYREPGITALAEFVDKMTDKFTTKLGDLIIFKDSNSMGPKSVVPNKNYIQITHVEPYFLRENKEERLTKFERENNLSHFFFQTPFTKSGRPHGSADSQYMLITILRTRNVFPYIKRRIEVIDSETIEQTPIEVAISALKNKTSDLDKMIRCDPPDLNLLELTLQGCVGTTVNEGPLEYYRVFLSADKVRKQAVNHVESLKNAFKYFIQSSFHALELVSLTLGETRLDYQEQLSGNYQELVDTLEPILHFSAVGSRRKDGNEFYTGKHDHSFMGDRSSFHSHLIFSAISGSPLH